MSSKTVLKKLDNVVKVEEQERLCNQQLRR